MLVSSQGYFHCLTISPLLRDCLPLVILGGLDPLHLLESLLCALYKCYWSPSDFLSFLLKSNDRYSLKLDLCWQPYVPQDACEEHWIKACFPQSDASTHQCVKSNISRILQTLHWSWICKGFNSLGASYFEITWQLQDLREAISTLTLGLWFDVTIRPC